MPGDPPLSTLLSWLLIAYTIEADNEFEHEMHSLGSRRAFRTSLVMWENLLRLVGASGVRVGDVPARAGLPSSKLHAYLAMERWGYVVVSPPATDLRAKPPRRDWVIGLTAVGERAARAWPTTLARTEARWRERFGDGEVDELRQRLGAVVTALGVDRPRALPVVGYGWRVEPAPIEHRRAAGTLPGGAAGAGEQGAGGSPHQPAAEPLGLSGLLSLTLLELTLEYERRSSLSLALSENVLRVAGRDPLPVTEVRRRAGISREAVAVAVAYLQRHGLGVVESTPGNGRAKALRLTSKGEHAAAGHAATMAAAEASLAERCGGDALAALQTTLARFATSTEGGRSRLAGGLAPYPEGWRATRPYASQTAAMLADPTGALPHHPLVTHRGGWPDGS